MTFVNKIEILNGEHRKELEEAVSIVVKVPKRFILHYPSRCQRLVVRPFLATVQVAVFIYFRGMASYYFSSGFCG